MGHFGFYLCQRVLEATQLLAEIDMHIIIILLIEVKVRNSHRKKEPTKS